jgi:hypothetical protein
MRPICESHKGKYLYKKSSNCYSNAYRHFPNLHAAGRAKENYLFTMDYVVRLDFKL